MKKKTIKKGQQVQNFTDVINKTINLYTNVGWKKWFAKIRVWDAPYIQVEKLVSEKGNILDLGCGEGLFSNFLAISSPQRTIYGVDVDKTRIKQANRGLKNTKFIYGDATKINIPPADTIIMFHLLHHLNSRKDQEDLLVKMKQKLKKKGQLIIVEVEPKLSLKYFAAWFTDHFLVPWLFEKRFYSSIYFRTSREWMSILKDNGFKSKIINAEGGMPFSHVILNSVKIN